MSARWPNARSKPEEIALAVCCVLVGAAVAMGMFLGCTRQAEGFAPAVGPR